MTPLERRPQRRPGFGLSSEWYRDAELYRNELDAIWRAGWCCIAHSCELEPGARVARWLVGEPIVVTRDEDGRVRAFYNVCRHRGSLVVTEEHSNGARLACPYHLWSYRLDGSLAGCPGAPEDFDRSAHGLIELGCEEVCGLVFVSLAPTPPDFAPARALFEAAARPQGLERARVAARRSYLVAANWKLVWENNRECTHCETNHPEYVTANFDRFVDVASVPETARRDLAAGLARLEALGLTGGIFDGSGLAEFPDPSGEVFASAHRTALAPGFVTESHDGEPVAVAMGDYAEADSGTLRLRSLPNFWCHASFDHAVTTRLSPAGIDATAIELTWLVDASACEGADYDPARLVAFWELVSEQDWRICERQQLGVTSSGFRPGPLWPGREDNVERFYSWYTAVLGGHVASATGPLPR